MSRPIASRFRITGTLVAETPIHVGGIDGNPATDLPLSVDGQGRLHVPGTSLAGPFRHWLIDRFGPERVEAFWGRIPRRNDDESGHASYVLVEDGKITPDAVTVEIRDGVGIDRAYGTAADRIKFDREVLPKGTSIGLLMTVDCPRGAEDGRGEICALLEALKQGEIRLGAAKTRGLGRVRLHDVQVECLDIGTSEGILALLKSRGAAPAGGAGLGALGEAAQPGLHPRIEIAIDWAPLAPVMVKASADGTAVDAMPLVTADGAGQETPVIPGSSSKGALRQQSERILATVLQVPVGDDPPGRQRFLGQLARLPLIETLYGAVKKREGDGSDRQQAGSGKMRPGRGALSIDDCPARLSMSRAEWAALADDALIKGTPTAEKQNRADAARALLDRARIDIATHVAIDRWTGGAADGALFTAAEPRLEWEPIRIEIDPARLVPSDTEIATDRETVKQAAIALLLLTLEDAANGLVPLGFGVNRGYGAIEVRRVAITVEHAPEDVWLSGLGSIQFAKRDGRVEIGPKDTLACIAEAWSRYIEDWTRHLTAEPPPAPHQNPEAQP
jgi:CRISPR/Cas system CSM-associated protein Csm3 (group 7 of RAMP superfamily)